jgi:hypothetical protein
MTHRTFLIPVTAVLVVVTAAAQPAHADPLLVTAGEFSIRFGGPPGIALVGDGFRFTSIMPVGHANVFDTCNFTCGPGTVLDLNTVITGFAEMHVPQTFNGVTYPGPMFFATDLHFSAPMVMLPAEIERRFEATVPFTFGGTLSAASEGRFTGGHVELTGPPLFSTTLAGQGTVHLSVIQASAVGGSAEQFALSGLRYVFEQTPAPTPEPATAVLLIGGMAVASGRRRR